MLISSMTARGFTLTASCMNVPLSSENGPNDIACAQPSTSVKKAVAAFTSGTVMPVWSWPRMPGMESAKADDAAAESVSAAKASSALGACLNSRCSILGESDSTLGYEQVFSPLEYRSDAASAAECAGFRAERPCLAVYR